jgi:hypothetical protein
MRLLPRLHAGSDAYPGVSRFMRRIGHPNIRFELRFVNDRSFSEKAMKIFSKVEWD